MSPAWEIIPGVDLPPDQMVNYAVDQPQYTTLPMWKGPEDGRGLRVSRWKLTWKERWAVLRGGSIWLSVFTFEDPLQPVKMEVVCPLVANLDDVK